MPLGLVLTHRHLIPYCYRGFGTITDATGTGPGEKTDDGRGSLRIAFDDEAAPSHPLVDSNWCRVSLLCRAYSSGSGHWARYFVTRRLVHEKTTPPQHGDGTKQQQ